MTASPEFKFGGKNETESDLAIARFRKDRLVPYALWRLGRPGAEKRSLRMDLEKLVTELGCGREWICARVKAMTEQQPENVPLADFLKRAPDGGKGKSKIRAELREPLTKALEHAIDMGATPGSRTANKIVRAFLARQGFPRNRQPSSKALSNASRAPAILIQHKTATEGEHMARVLGQTTEVRSPNEVVLCDWTTFSSTDEPQEVLWVYDRHDRLLGVANVMFGVCAGTRGLWTLLPIVGAPNSYLSAFAMRRGFLEKQPLLQQLGIKGVWPFHGKPGRLVTDRGSEFVGKQIQRTLEGMDIAYREVSPAQTPHFRSKAERFNRTAHVGMADFQHSEIGRKYFFPAPGKPNAYGIRFEHLDRAFIEWAISRYHPNPHKGLGGASPLDRMDDMVNGRKGFPLCGPLVAMRDSPELMWDFLWEERRVINHTGISIENRNYSSDALTQFLVPGTRSSGTRQSVRYNPYGIGHVFVRAHDTREIFKVPYRHRNDLLPMTTEQVMETTNPSIWEWRTAYADLKRVGVEKPQPEQVIEVIGKRDAKLKDPDTVISSTITQRDAANFEMRHAFASSGPAATAPKSDRPAPPRISVVLPVGRGGADEY